MLFRYQRAGDGQPAIATIRGTFKFVLGNAATKARDFVTHKHGMDKVMIRPSYVDRGAIGSHGDAICELGLLTEVIRPASLQQTLNDNR
ncbi:PRANC domain protein [Fusarium beomiforme]|uniref:PRANC domain protein n=1 Tax=Fusarium beomiforme TaxID=44412 RepID=A0A9P5AN69_9HYPO|nr:PRANC domain protein [Fusarium beomiforme]